MHKSEYINIQRPINPKTKHPIEPAHRFDVTLEPDNFTEEKYASCLGHLSCGKLSTIRFLLFADYQKAVHHEGNNDLSFDSFKRFLCSGLGQSDVIVNGQRKKIGSYHQCYRLDGELVALGVIDLLPHCVSSVYLM